MKRASDLEDVRLTLRVAVPLAQCRCQQADTNRVGQVTDCRTAIGEAETGNHASPLMSAANMTSLRRPGTLTESKPMSQDESSAGPSTPARHGYPWRQGPR